MRTLWSDSEAEAEAARKRRRKRWKEAGREQRERAPESIAAAGSERAVGGEEGVSESS